MMNKFFNVDFLSNSIKKPFMILISSIHRRQLKSKVLPATSCFSHAVSNILSSVKIYITPDEITTALNSQKWIIWASRNIKGSMKYRGKMQVLWDLQVAYINHILKINNRTDIKAVFSTSRLSNVELKEVMEINNSPIVMDTYPYYAKKHKRLGHVIAAVGYAEEKTTTEVAKYKKIEKKYREFMIKKFGDTKQDWLAIDDSFGNMIKDYIYNEVKYNYLKTQQMSGNDTMIPTNWMDNVRGSFSIRFYKV